MSTRTQTASAGATPVMSPMQRMVTSAIDLPQTSPKMTVESKDVNVQLHYLQDLPLYKHTKPLQITPNFADKEHLTNVQLEPGQPETIRDVRGIHHGFSLDDNGFKYVKAPTAFADWSSQPKIAQDYLPELEALLRREVGNVDEILFYDARIRQSGDEGLRVSGLSYNPFARQVHLDNTETSVIEKIKNLTDMKADYLLKGRCRVINIWRPIKHQVYDCSLAVADCGKLKEGDIIECDRRLASTGAYHDTMGVVRYRKGLDWYYCGDMAEDDILLFKGYDSSTSVRARHCLHTAFDLPQDMIPKGAPTRESIEVRALIFTYPSTGRRPSRPTLEAHPLAHELQQGNLKHIHDEHSIIDAHHEDIDMARDEVKDAVLLLRRQEINRLERLNDALTAERDGLTVYLMTANSKRDRAHAESHQAQKQIAIQTSGIEALEHKNRMLKQQLSQSYPDLRRQLHETSRDLVDARVEAYAHGQTTAHFQMENEKLLEHIHGQEGEIQRWRNEAMGKGSECVSRCWQASVDEAVRREREKDAWVVKQLQDEVAGLQRQVEGNDRSENA